MVIVQWYDKINALVTTKPDFGSDEEQEDTKAKVMEPYIKSDVSDDEFRLSKICRQNVDALEKVDKRYAGKKISRKDIYSDEDDNMSKDVGNEGSNEDAEDEEMDGAREQSNDELGSNRKTNLKEGCTDVSESVSDLKEQDDDNIDTNDPMVRNVLKLWQIFFRCEERNCRHAF
ncbi:uncharacterized protein LOC112455707 isoform X1 [Temnothorax curvispinosus]|uniref:Uncharacterized protein LOC112455707 isoform X1 n=2 Tax=Temnothorax curvispinosus TaxID=300111 RepID=A0A6J1PUL9_9HYME|nr:uncharacterized protein LOC112455707 isoform X1 [Temnothorax curvispinosus]